MSNIQSHYIDFRDEHRIYLLGGCLCELVGMIADTDYDEWNEYSISNDSSPVTWYKFITNSKFMNDGGHYMEGSLPPIFAHRGDRLEIRHLMKYLLSNIYYNTDSPIVLLEDLGEYGLTIGEEVVADIVIKLCHVWDGFRVESNYNVPLMFIRLSKETPHQIIFSVDGKEKIYSIKRLAKELGDVIYAFREFFENDVKVSSIVMVEDECKPQRREVDAPAPYQKFLRLIELGAEIEKRYWDNLR